MPYHHTRTPFRSLLAFGLAGLIALACSSGSDPVGPDDEPEPEPDPSQLLAEQVSVGDMTQCVRTEDNEVLCWGIKGMVVGDGTGTRRLHPVPVDMPGVPMRMVSVGHHSACALDMDGRAYCWGQYDIGTGSAGQPGPTPLPGDHVFASIAVGVYTACALKEDGSAWCWGTDASGVRHASPTAVSSTLRFRNIIPGSRPQGNFSRTCGLTLDRSIYCWGMGGFGDPESVIPEEAPALVESSVELVSLASSGRRHFCGLTETGKAYCWGSNNEGQLGTGTISHSEETPQAVVGGLTFVALSASLNHTCGLVQSGDLYCWGSQMNGALGNGSTEPVSVPTPQPVVAPAGVKFTSVDAGLKGTCAIATNTGVYCWGMQGLGEFGLTMDPTPVPVQVAED